MSIMKTQTLLSTDELEAVRRRFNKPLVQRRDALRLICAFGHTDWKARMMIEGSAAAFKPVPKQRPSEWDQWHRETIITALNVPLS